MEFSVKDTLRASIEAVSGGRNTIMYDDQGNPNIMVCIPKFDTKYMGVPIPGTHPAFNLGNGKECPEIWVSKYQNTHGNGGVPVSVIFDDRIPTTETIPTTSKFERFGFYDCTPSEGAELCEKKGKGWHLMSNIEWCATFQQGIVMRTGAVLKNRAESYFGSLSYHTHDGTPDGVTITHGSPDIVDGIALRWYDEFYAWIDQNGDLCNDFINKPMKPTSIRIDAGFPVANSSFPHVHIYKIQDSNRAPANDGRVGGSDPNTTHHQMLNEIDIVTPMDDVTKTRIMNMGLVSINDYDTLPAMCFDPTVETDTGEELSMIRGTSWQNSNLKLPNLPPGAETPMMYAFARTLNHYGIRSVWISPDYL